MVVKRARAYRSPRNGPTANRTSLVPTGIAKRPVVCGPWRGGLEKKKIVERIESFPIAGGHRRPPVVVALPTNRASVSRWSVSPTL